MKRVDNSYMGHFIHFKTCLQDVMPFDVTYYRILVQFLLSNLPHIC